MFEALAP